MCVEGRGVGGCRCIAERKWVSMLQQIDDLPMHRLIITSLLMSITHKLYSGEFQHNGLDGGITSFKFYKIIFYFVFYLAVSSDHHIPLISLSCF